MPDPNYSVILNFPRGQTVVNEVNSPLIDLLVDVVSIGGGGGGVASVSPDPGNALEQRPNGLYVNGPVWSSENW